MTHVIYGAMMAGAIGMAWPLKATAQGAPLQGITFAVDTLLDGTPLGPVPITPLGLKVVYAGKRGRIDVIARPTRPAIQIGEVVTAPSLAAPGDYYLFDSAGFVLVRPATKQFSTFRLSHYAFNYEGRRDGWPEFFQLQRLRTDTIVDKSSPLLRQHGELTMYWHLDVLKDTICGFRACSIEELARGKAVLTDAPPAELIVARWFGPAQALAEIPGGIGRFIEKPIRVTTVSPVTGGHRLRDLRSAAVDPETLTLPANYIEIRWPGFRDAPPLSSDRGAKWRLRPKPR